MKKVIYCSFFVWLIVSHSFGQVAIGTGNSAPAPNSKAVLYLTGTNQGLIIPIVNNLLSVGATSSEKGMVVYNNADNKVYYFDGTTWNGVGGGSAGSQGIQITGNTVSLNSTAGATFGLATPSPTGAGQLLVWTGTAWEPTPVPTTTGQVLSWNQTTGKWAVTTPAATSNLSGDVTGPFNSTLIANSAGNSIVSALNNAATTSKILPTQITAGSANQVLTTSGGGVVGWANPSTGGTISGVVAGTGLSGGGASGSVTLNMANTAVTAGVYGNASNVGQFTVDPQGRITNAVNVPISSVLPTLGGDISGTISSATVTGIQGRPISATSPGNGQILQFSSGQWGPANAVTAVSTTAPLISVVAGSTVTIGLTSPLPVGNGGTGRTTWNGVVYGSGSTLSDISTATPGQLFISSASTPNWQTMSGDATIDQTGNLSLNTVAATGIKLITAINNTSGSPFISGARITPNFGSGNITTSGTLVVSGGVSLTSSSLQIGPVSYNWPGTQGAAGTVLTNNGSGTLTWNPLFSTSNIIPKGNGTSLVASSLTDDGTTVSSSANLSFPNITNSIQFPAVGAAAPPMMYMFASGTLNNNRFVIAHSPAFPTWGLEYDDPTDRFHFNIATARRLSISGVGVGINQDTPLSALDVNGGLTVGNAYSGANVAPTNGAIIQGNVGIGNNAPTVPLDVTGNTRIVGAVGIGTAPGADDLTIANGSSSTQLISSFNGGVGIGSFAGSRLYLQSGTASVTSSQWGINATSGGLLILGQQSLSSRLWFSKDGSAVAVLDDNYFAPYSDSQLDLGTSTFRWNRLYYTSGVLGTSDARLKNSITPIQYGLSEVLKMRPVSFVWNKFPEQGKQLGLIAQDVQKLLPELVVEADNTEKTLALNHVQLIPVLIKAIQEQQKAIEDLRAENKSLKELTTRVKELNEKVEALLKTNSPAKAAMVESKEKP